MAWEYCCSTENQYPTWKLSASCFGFFKWKNQNNAGSNECGQSLPVPKLTVLCKKTQKKLVSKVGDLANEKKQNNYELEGQTRAKTPVNIGITFNRWPDKGDRRDVRVALFLLDM